MTIGILIGLLAIQYTRYFRILQEKINNSFINPAYLIKFNVSTAKYAFSKEFIFNRIQFEGSFYHFFLF